MFPADYADLRRSNCSSLRKSARSAGKRIKNSFIVCIFTSPSEMILHQWEKLYELEYSGKQKIHLTEGFL